MSDAVVTATGVRKSFDEEGVLEGVDIAVEEGELLVLMGPNGVGKSVLLSCLAGSDRPSEGRVSVFDEPATERADTTSFLLQDALCHEKLTGRENVAFYDRLHPEFTDAWREYVDRFEIADALGKSVEDYSGGMTRKLELSIAASIDVPIYLFDEPTAALDLPTIQTVHDLFREKQAAGKTLVVSSHRPMDADIADRVAFLADGRIAATGTPDELLSSLPPILETGTTNTDAIGPVIDGDPYAVAGAVRGFLPEEGRFDAADEGDRVDDVAATIGVDPGDLAIVEPTYTDLFNYYTHAGP